MGLFGNKDVSVEEEEKFAPIVLRTENVAKEIIEVSKNYRVHVHNIDFNILSVHTYTRITSENSDSEFEELYEEDLVILNDESMLLNENFEIKQVYEIELFYRTEADKNSIESSIGANSQKSTIYFTLKEGSIIEWYDEFESDFILYINKKKLRANLLIYVFDSVMYDPIKIFVAKLRVNETMEITEKEMLLVAQSIDPQLSVNDKLILNYEDNEEKNSNEKVDHSKRGYITSVTKDEVIITYIKAQLGTPGRNCRGEFIAPKEPQVTCEPKFNISESISVKDEDGKIEYLAKESGYVTFEGGTYDIKKDVEISEISFKTTGSIETGLDADVNISVKESDIFKDAIGMGMEVEVSELKVDGNVGPNAKIIANKVNIEGQTHKSSFINSDKIEVNIHKGKAEGREIHITRLEHGEVVGDDVSISQALGGTIRANEVKVETLGSHTTIMATSRIEINKLKGEENTFVIDPVLRKSGKAELEASEAEIHDSRISLRHLDEEIVAQNELLEKNKKTFNDLKKRLLHYKKNGVKMPSAFVAKYKQFQEAYAKLDELEKERKQKNDRIELMSAKHDAQQGDVFAARIINKDVWKGHNEIKFKLIEPLMELSYIPKTSDKKIFGLKKDSEGDIYIGQFDE